ncbi:reverse transcriptase [Gossypium australe]|uniref:Reverse transcriptase n=1 Tax=Gossypium australe TaxID=47621 RepID=A0A5B6U8E0_9ROSI|nr:reverse transcriptase [Gossypium australe]
MKLHRRHQLGQLTHKEVDDNSWRLISIIKNGLSLSHVFFADYLFLFAEADVNQARMFIVDKIRRKLDSWNAKMLPMARKVTLAHSVLMDIPNCFMQTVKILVSICAEIERIARGFRWGKDARRQGMSLVKWLDCCQTHNGGLDIQNIKEQNESFLLNLANLSSKPYLVSGRW